MAIKNILVRNHDDFRTCRCCSFWKTFNFKSSLSIFISNEKWPTLRDQYGRHQSKKSRILRIFSIQNLYESASKWTVSNRSFIKMNNLEPKWTFFYFFNPAKWMIRNQFGRSIYLENSAGVWFLWPPTFAKHRHDFFEPFSFTYDS